MDLSLQWLSLKTNNAACHKLCSESNLLFLVFKLLISYTNLTVSGLHTSSLLLCKECNIKLGGISLIMIFGSLFLNLNIPVHSSSVKSSSLLDYSCKLSNYLSQLILLTQTKSLYRIFKWSDLWRNRDGVSPYH